MEDEQAEVLERARTRHNKSMLTSDPGGEDSDTETVEEQRVKTRARLDGKAGAMEVETNTEDIPLFVPTKLKKHKHQDKDKDLILPFD